MLTPPAQNVNLYNKKNVLFPKIKLDTRIKIANIAENVFGNQI